MDASVVIFSVDTLSGVDLLPVEMILIAIALIFGPLLIGPFFLKSRTEATGKKPAIAASIGLLAVFGILYGQSISALQDEREALDSGAFTMMSGTYDGQAMTNLAVIARVDQIKVAGAELSPPGGILGAWSRAVRPSYVAPGQAVDVAVHNGVYLQIARK